MLSRLVVVLIAAAVLLFAEVRGNASDVPVFAKPGDWVVEVDLDEVLQKSPDSEAIIVILDQQTQLQPGLVSSYRDVAIRIDSTKTMTSMLSLFTPTWHPDHGDLIIHRYEIVRNGAIIDLTQTEDLFQIIRREKNLERQMVNGNLTAISQVEDLQLGDIVRMSLTTTVANEALDGRVQSSGGFIPADVNIDFIRQTVTWPDEMDVNWRVSKEEITPTRYDANGWSLLEFDHRSKEPDIEIPENAPLRFRQGDYYEVASFGSWSDVSKINAKLYSEDDGIAPGGALDLEIQKIANQTTDKRERTALALQLVQERVRYLFNGLGFGNYTPQSPEETWRLRYGDCKAKTYLLLAALRRLGIPSAPMLVNLDQRDAVAERLPSFQAFNHILVRAEIDGKVYWLDGTSRRTALADIADSPRHRFGLPSRSQGADLEDIPIRRLGRPRQSADVTYDLSAGTDLPAPFTLKLELRDSDAQNLRDAATQYSEEKARELREKIARKYVINGLVTQSKFDYDAATETGYLAATGLAYLSWERKGQQRRHYVWSQASAIKVQKSRSEEELRDLPVVLGSPFYFVYNTSYVLPEKYSEAKLEGEMSVQGRYAGFQFSRDVHRSGNTITSTEQRYTAQWELAAKDFEPERRRLALLDRNKVSIVLPPSSPEPWEDIVALRGSDKLEEIRQSFGDYVQKASSDKDDALASRAYFLRVIGEYDLAIADLEEALAIKPDPERFRRLGDLSVGSDRDRAKANYRKALEIRPTYFDALLALIRAHLLLDEFDEANAVVSEAKKAGLQDASADSLLIEILQAEGKYDEALQIMNALVEEEPESSTYLSDRCLLRALEGKEMDLALDDCTNMIEIAERSSYFHFVRALAYFQDGSYEQAVLDLNKAIKVSDDDSTNYYLRAIAHQKLGNKLEAEDDLKAAKYFFKHYNWYWSRFFE